MAIVNQCKSVAHSQEQTVRALEAQLLRDADEARRQLQLTTQHLEAEKDQIMAALRNAMMQGFPQAAPAVPMTMMPAAPPMAMAAAYTPQMAALGHVCGRHRKDQVDEPALVLALVDAVDDGHRARASPAWMF
jgi:cytochrome c1